MYNVLAIFKSKGYFGTQEKKWLLYLSKTKYIIKRVNVSRSLMFEGSVAIYKLLPPQLTVKGAYC